MNEKKICERFAQSLKHWMPRRLMLMMKVLICGDSYADERYGGPVRGYGNAGITWIELLRKDYSVDCVGQAGDSNVEILAQMLKHRQPYHRAIVHLTTLDRGGDVKRSIKAVRKILSFDYVYAWSIYPEFMDTKNVDWQPFVAYNEAYIGLENHDFTGCHFTQEGNYALYEHMKHIIKYKF